MVKQLFLFIALFTIAPLHLVTAQVLTGSDIIAGLKCKNDQCFESIVKAKGFEFLKIDNSGGATYTYWDNTAGNTAAIFFPTDKSFTTVAFTTTNQEESLELVRDLCNNYGFVWDDYKNAPTSITSIYYSSSFGSPKASIRHIEYTDTKKYSVLVSVYN